MSVYFGRIATGGGGGPAPTWEAVTEVGNVATLGATQNVRIDGATTQNVGTAGILDVDLSTGGAGVAGIDVTMVGGHTNATAIKIVTAHDAIGGTTTGISVAPTVSTTGAFSAFKASTVAGAGGAVKYAFHVSGEYTYGFYCEQATQGHQINLTGAYDWQFYALNHTGAEVVDITATKMATNTATLGINHTHNIVGGTTNAITISPTLSSTGTFNGLNLANVAGGSGKTPVGIAIGTGYTTAFIAASGNLALTGTNVVASIGTNPGVDYSLNILRNTTSGGADQYGIYIDARTTAVTNVTGVHAIAEIPAAGAPLSATGIAAGVYINATATVANIYGIRAIGQAQDGVVTNAYALYVTPPTGATTINRAIHVTGGEVYFGGTLVQVGLADFDAGFKIATAQSANWYNTADETGNYERLKLAWALNVLTLDVQSAGTGTLRNFAIAFNGTQRVVITPAVSTIAAMEPSGYGRWLDDVPLYFGAGNNAQLEWDTAETNDALKLGLVVGAAASSGNFIICEKADIGVDFALGTTTNPRILVWSADGTATGETGDWIGLWHDQTIGHLDSGAGLTIGASGKALGLYGVTPVARSTGWSATNYTPDKTINIGGEWSTITLGNVVATLINELIALGAIGA